MSIKAGIGISDKPGAEEAGREACRQAMEDVRRPDLLLVFASTNYDQVELLAGIRHAGKEIPLIGCSDAGEITSFGTIRGGVAVMALVSDNVKFSVCTGGDVRNSSRTAGMELARNAKKADKDISGLIMFSDVVRGNGSQIIEGVQDELGRNFPVVGGATGDDFSFKETFVYVNNSVYPSAVAGVGLSGDYSMGVGVSHGWMPIGLPVKVTRSHGAVVEELDGQPAIRFYEEHFGKKIESLIEDSFAQLTITYPLGMPSGGRELLVREPIDVNGTGGIRFTAGIPENTDVRLMLGSREDIVQAAGRAAGIAMAALGGRKPQAAIAISCVARDKLLGQNVDEELKAIQSVIGRETPLVGYYAYGEYAPVPGMKSDSKSVFHNGAIVVIVF